MLEYGKGSLLKMIKITSVPTIIFNYYNQSLVCIRGAAQPTVWDINLNEADFRRNLRNIEPNGSREAFKPSELASPTHFYCNLCWKTKHPSTIDYN